MPIITFDKVMRLQNGRIGVALLEAGQSILRTSDGKQILLTGNMGKYTPIDTIVPNKSYFLNDAQILAHLATRNKRLLADQVVTWDGHTCLTPTETELKATLRYLTSAAPRLPTFRLSDYLNDLAHGADLDA